LKLYCDNFVALFKANNNRSESQIKHVSTELMIFDPLTKGMPLKSFKDHIAQMRIGSML